MKMFEYINFEYLIVWITFISGLLSLFDLLFLARRRYRFFLQAIDSYRSALITVSRSRGKKMLIDLSVWLFGRKYRSCEFSNLATVLPSELRVQAEQLLQPKGLFDYAHAFFPIFLLVLLIRSFLFEGYLVPTGSLEPTVLPGDFLFVDKYSYGLRAPVSHHVLVTTGVPQRGEIAVFRWPNDQTNYVKRVVGIPGDRIRYINKMLVINDQLAAQRVIEHNADGTLRVEEDLLGTVHEMLLNPSVPTVNIPDFIVPEGYYFMMGDNRDDSRDSRYRGFVADDDLIGQAHFIFFSKVPDQWRVRWHRIGHELQKYTYAK